MGKEAGRFPFFRKLFRVSLVILPYVSYGGMVGLFAVLVYLLRHYRKLALDAFVGRGLGAIALLLVVSSTLAFDRGEAFLQLANFLPYFLFFATLPHLLGDRLLRSQIARDAVIAVIPLNLYSVVEYSFKADWFPVGLQQIPLVASVRAAPHAWRAMTTFHHPNTFASYLVLVFGLGLGSILMQLRRSDRSIPVTAPHSNFLGDSKANRLLFLGTFLCLPGIFCSGSRNGLLVAVSQLLIFALCVKFNRKVLWAALGGVGAIVLTAGALGVAGRTLSPAALVNDPRVKVWQFAFDLLVQRPWLGWGLGNYKLKYPPGLIPDYDFIAHPHNFWLLLAVEAGIPVMIGLTVVVGYICDRAARKFLSGELKPTENALLIGYGLAFWGCVAFALFDVTFYDVRVNAMNWIILASLYCFGKFSYSVPETG